MTEGITNVNIPAAQLMVGMGIPLYRIPDIRAVYGQDKYGKDRFDLEHTPQRQPDCHVVAVRITSENAGDGFKPTAGRIDELGFKPTPEVWGYFSVKGGGGIHEFSDSQVRQQFEECNKEKHCFGSMHRCKDTMSFSRVGTEQVAGDGG